MPRDSMGVALAFLSLALCFSVVAGGAATPQGLPPREARPAPGARTEPRPLEDRPTREGPGRAASENDAAVSRAIDYVVSMLGRDGSYNLADARNPAPVAVTALATLSLLAHGDVCGRGPRGHVVERGVLYLLAQQDRSGGGPDRNPRFGFIGTESDKYSKMHGHGFATLALAEAYGMVGGGRAGLVNTATLRQAIVDAVAVIERSQEPETGGWYYEPLPHGHEGSVTICVVQALRAARNAGIQVSSGTIERAIDYVRRSQKADGSFRYALGDDRSSPALTAAAISTLNATGDYDSKIIEKGIDYLLAIEPSRPLAQRFAGREPRFPHYERLYLAQAYYQNRDQSLFTRWFPAEASRLLGEQKADGSWTSEEYGSVYATAMTALVLQIPFQYLPIFQR